MLKVFEYIPFTFKNPPFIARIFYQRALHPRAFSLAAQFTLLQRLEIADSSCAFAPQLWLQASLYLPLPWGRSPPAKSTHSKRGILERERYSKICTPYSRYDRKDVPSSWNEGYASQSHDGQNASSPGNDRNVSRPNDGRYVPRPSNGRYAGFYNE